MDLSLIEILVALAVTTVAAALQSTVGFGFGVMSVPILALVDNSLVPVPQLLMALPLVSAMAWRERHGLDLKGVGWILSGRVMGAGAGLLMIKLLSGQSLDAAIGILVILLVLAVTSGVKPNLTHTTQLSGGIVAGVAGMVASMGGPPLALLYREQSGAKMRSTLAFVFFFGIAITVAFRIGGSEIAWADVWIALILLPAMFAGFRLAGPLLKRVEGIVLRTTVLVVSGVAGFVLLLRAAV